MPNLSILSFLLLFLILFLFVLFFAFFRRLADLWLRFLYVGFDEYRPAVRVDARDRLGGFAANTIFRKEL